MKQTYWIMPEGGLLCDDNNCDKECEIRDECERQLAEIMTNEGKNGLRDIVTDAVECEKIQGECFCAVEEIILTS